MHRLHPVVGAGACRAARLLEDALLFLPEGLRCLLGMLLRRLLGVQCAGEFRFVRFLELRLGDISLLHRRIHLGRSLGERNLVRGLRGRHRASSPDRRGCRAGLLGRHRSDRFGLRGGGVRGGLGCALDALFGRLLVLADEPRDLPLDLPGFARVLEIIGLFEAVWRGRIDRLANRIHESLLVKAAGLLPRHLFDLGGARLAGDLIGRSLRGGLRLRNLGMRRRMLPRLGRLRVDLILYSQKIRVGRRRWRLCRGRLASRWSRAIDRGGGGCGGCCRGWLLRGALFDGGLLVGGLRLRRTLCRGLLIGDLGFCRTPCRGLLVGDMRFCRCLSIPLRGRRRNGGAEQRSEDARQRRGQHPGAQ